jgi:signal transduction histidine kinase
MLMFKSLEAKLIATYALVVALSLLVAGIATVAVVNAVQLTVAERYLQAQATLVGRGIEIWMDQGRPLVEVRQLLQRQRTGTMHVFFLNSDGRVIAHVGPPGEDLSLEGQVIEDLPQRPALAPAPTPQPGQAAPARRFTIPRLPIGPVNRIDLGTRTLVYAIVPIPRNPRVAAELRQNAPAYVGIAQSVNEIAAWPYVARPLVVIGLLVFALTVLLGVWLARSITKPIGQMTQASEAMARGDYQQTIQVAGDDEVARLGQAFNTMSREVDRAHAMQRDFLVNVSHDLKTPLTSIQGFAQAMTDGTLQSVEDYQRAGSIIHAESERMRRLIGQLLDLARLQGGEAILAHDQVDLLPILASSGKLAQERAATSGIEVTTRLPATLPPIVGDAPRLEQVVNNLLDNALKYTPAQGRVDLSAGVTPGGVAFTVCDTGPGIPKEHLERIFERFYRGDRARASDGGSGLGLAIVREIVEAHHGRIQVDSQVGYGTALTVLLPAAARG